MESERMRPNKDVVSRRVGEEVVLVQLDSDQMFSLNPTGARAWELLSEGRDLEAIEAAIADEFGVDREAVRRGARFVGRRSWCARNSSRGRERSSR